MDTDGDAIPDAAVQISGPTSGTAVTDAAGFYSAVVEAGNYAVTATATEDGVQVTGRASYCAKGTVSAQACAISVGDNDGTANFTAGQEVSGTIAEQATPQADVTVELAGTRDNGSAVSLKTTTDKAGGYSFAPPPGTYPVTPQVPADDTAVADGFAAQTCPGGKAQDGSCQDLALVPDATDKVNFQFGCGVEGVKLDKVETLVDTDPDFGAVPYSTVQLLGKGFCPNMTVDFGNSLAESVVDTTKDPSAISQDGTVAQVVVARLATTGTVVVVSNGTKATLDNVQIDSFRNVYGFNFPNINGTLTQEEFEHVFPSAVVTEPYNACPPANCPGHTTELSWQALDAFTAIAADFSGGDCFGFSLGAARLAPGGDLNGDIDDVQAGAKDTWDIKEDYTGDPQNPGPVRDFLNQLQLVQWSTQEIALSSQAAQTNLKVGGAQIMSEINNDIDNDPASTGKYDDGAIILLDHANWVKTPTPHWEWEGHALLAYNVENDNSGPAYGAVDVYDSNGPFLPAEDGNGNLHRSRLNKSVVYVYADGSWYDQALGWRGRSQTISVLSVEQLEQALDAGLTYSNPSGVNAMPDEGTIIAALTAPDGDAVDLAQGGSQGVALLPPLTGGAASAAVPFSGPPGVYTERLTGAGPLSEVLETNGYQVTVDASPGTDKVTFDTATDTITVGPAATGTPSSTASVTVDQDTANGGVQSATVTGSPRAGPIALGYTSGGEASVTASARRARDVSLTLTNEVTGAVPQSFVAPLALPAGATATVPSPTWATYTGAPVTASVGPAGKSPKEVTLANHARPAPEPKVRGARVSGHSLIVSLSLPALPPGSALKVTATFVNSKKAVEHKATTVVTHLGHASTRAIWPRGPRRRRRSWPSPPAHPRW